jgi:hypothetical protein
MNASNWCAVCARVTVNDMRACVCSWVFPGSPLYAGYGMVTGILVDAAQNVTDLASFLIMFANRSTTLSPTTSAVMVTSRHTTQPMPSVSAPVTLATTQMQSLSAATAATVSASPTSNVMPVTSQQSTLSTSQSRSITALAQQTTLSMATRCACCVLIVMPGAAVSSAGNLTPLIIVRHVCTLASPLTHAITCRVWRWRQSDCAAALAPSRTRA